MPTWPFAMDATTPKNLDLASTDSAKGAALIGHFRGGKVDKYLPHYSADAAGCAGDGVTDDTAKLQALCSIPGATVILSPLKIYRVGNLRLADKVRLMSWTGRGYTGLTGADANDGAILRMLVGAQCLLNVSGKRGPSVEGVVLDGVNRSAPCISAGSSRLDIIRSRIINGLYAVGGAVDGGSSYTSVMHMRGSVAASNGMGLRNLIDSFVFQVELAANGTNLYQQAGANSNIFSGTRFEWPSSTLGAGKNIVFSGSSDAAVSDNNFMGCQLDRGAFASVDANWASGINFAGGFARRSNASGSALATDDCLFNFRQSNNISVTGMSFSRGANDDGTGNVSPSYVVNFDGSNDKIVFMGNTVRSGDFAGFARNTQNATNLTIEGNPGIADFCNDVLKPQRGNGSIYRDRQTASVTASGGTASLTLSARNSVPDYDNSMFVMTLSVRDPSTGSAYSALVSVVIRREGSGSAATAVGLTVLGQSTTNFIGVGVGTLRLSTANVASDGSTFDLVLTNTGANALQAKVRLNL